MSRRRKYPIQLIPLTYVTGSDTDMVSEGTRRSILADRKSINRSEFYPAFANGLRPEVAFVVWTYEYANEPRLSYNGMDYEIIRTHTGEDEREIELICQPLSLVQTGLSRLRDSVEIWYNTTVKNSMSEKSPRKERLFTLPAQVEFVGGGTANVSGRVIETTNNAKVTIRYREGIRPDMFLMIAGQRYDIRYIEDPYNRHETLTLHTERVVP
ncbi:phage head closure protein [Paenibacillus oleatilyticus]|uniref:phage head closure protein n=1 Tax=Paenibacillus oleatilyticus TaxID=2594886 RepID=UPI001C1F62F1|nr:phage head closure protein [Paenibacillus oleatilyticus]MBU7320280.1 phage head closure protein [Paenibacillus oleatilyticus]